MPTADQLIDAILRREGGFVDHPADRGGPTKFGITLATLTEYRKPAPVTADDVKALTEPEARQIFWKIYVGPFVDWTPHQVLPLVVDSAVLHGVGRATQWLQRAAAVKDDGAIGPATRAAVSAMDGALLHRKVLAARVRSLGKTIQMPGQVVFAAGWLNRVAEFIEEAP